MSMFDVSEIMKLWEELNVEPLPIHIERTSGVFRMETPGQTRDTLERLYLFSLGTPQDPPQGACESGRIKEGPGSSSEAAAPGETWISGG